MFFSTLEKQNKLSIQQKSELWSFDFEKSEEKFEFLL